MAEIEQQPLRGGRARHLVHRDDRYYGLSCVVDRDKRYVYQTTVELRVIVSCPALTRIPSTEALI